jgi:hypothetical protein
LVNKDICRDDQSFSEHNPAASLFPLFDTPVDESFANSTARNTSIATIILALLQSLYIDYRIEYMESIRYNVYKYTINCSLSYIRFFIDLKCQPALVQMSARAGLIVSPGLVQMSAPGWSKCQPRAGPNVSPVLV